MENAEKQPAIPGEEVDEASFDYGFVDTVGRIALYDDLRSAPRIIEVSPAETAAYIEALASNVYEQARGAGGAIPYSVIREVSENFIHARFKEVVVSILDEGNTIRFADHGPGIPEKEKAQKPGFTSANEAMKRYIRGVGSGLPIVRDYLESFQGTITIEDNLGTGAVVTVSLIQDADGANESPRLESSYQEAAALGQPTAPGIPGAQPAYPPQASPAPYPPANPYAAPTPGEPVHRYPSAYPGVSTSPLQSAPYGAPGFGTYPTGAAAYGYAPPAASVPPLNDREERMLRVFLTEGIVGITDMVKYTDIAQSTVHNDMVKLEEAGLITRVGKKRTLTPYGEQIARALR